MSEKRDNDEYESTDKINSDEFLLGERMDKLRRTVPRLLYAYTALVTLPRLFSNGGLLIMGLAEAFMRADGGLSVGGVLLAPLPVVISFHVLKKGLTHGSLVYIQCLAGAAFCSHLIGFVLAILHYGMISEFATKGALVVPFLQGVLSLLAFILFTRARKLYLLTNASEGAGYGRGLAILLLFLLQPYLNVSFGNLALGITNGITNAISNTFNLRGETVISAENCLTLPSMVTSVSVSPDRKFIALGCASNLTVLDANTREPIFTDTSIRGRSVKFSPSGKYLAAACTVASGDMSGLALYEVDGFKRVPRIFLEPDPDPKKTLTVLDVAFRPDEKSLLIIYYSYWERRRFSREEWEALSGSSTMYQESLEWPQICDEIEISSGNVVNRKVLGAKCGEAITSFSFSQDSSMISYVHLEQVDSRHMRHNGFIDTRTWDEKIWLNDRKYRVDYILSDTTSTEKIFFAYTRMLYLSEARTGIPRESVLAELNMDNFTFRDIVDSNIAVGQTWEEKSSKLMSMGTFANSKAALMGAVLDKDGLYGKKNFHFFIVTVNLQGEPSPKIRKCRLGSGMDEYRLRSVDWLDEKQLIICAAAASRTASGEYDAKVFFVSTPEEEIAK